MMSFSNDDQRITSFSDAAAKLAVAEAEAATLALARKQECDAEINGVYANIVKNQEEYDKQLLTLSTGYLVLSISFIKDIVHLDHAVYRGLLYASFCLLALCTMLVLLSYQMSNHAHYAAKEYWENQKDGDGKREYPYGFAVVIRFLNWSTGILFCAGIAFSVCFVVVNIHHEANMKSEDSTPAAIRQNPPPRPPPPGVPLKTPTKPPPPPKG
jgi:hypothetical protein